MGTYDPNHNYGAESAEQHGGLKPQLSEARLAANRANALKSTGPRTEEGKARSSRNALRHGLTGQVSVNTGEDRAAHKNFTAGIIEGLNPEGIIERQLALCIADHYWRLHRARAMEDNIFALGNFGPAGDIDVDHAELHTALTSAQVFVERSATFDRLTLYEQRIRRALREDTAKLEQLQAKRHAEREAALEEAARIAKVLDHDGEEQPEEIAVRGFVFANEEIIARADHNRTLKKFAFHERHSWDEDIEYPAAA